MVVVSNFPIEYVSDNDKVLCLFSAAFGGKNDVLHLVEKGVKNVYVLDNDYHKLIDLSRNTGYKMLYWDAFTYLNQADTVFDVIISDHYTNVDERIHKEYFERLKRMCRKWLILGIAQKYMDKHGKPDGEYVQRSEYEGGIFWRVIKP